jgi:multidrug efflux pump subunit AcrA (membrane-fusion protein)
MSKRCLLAFLVSGVLAACEATPVSQSAGPSPIQVRVTAVRRGEIADVLTVTGQTEALSVLRLASPVAGRITVLAVRPGDRLQAGEVAARVRPIENEAAVHGFALLGEAGALDTHEYEIARKLQQDIGGRDISLRVPFPAVVADRLRNPDEQVAQNDVLLELFDPTSLYVVAQVPVEAAARIEVGMPVEVAAAGSIAHGQVEARVTALTPQALTVPVRIALAAPLKPPLLRAAVRCTITVVRHPDALLIPRSALLTSNVAEHGTVMAAVAHRAQRRTVHLGLRSTTEVEVTSGVAAGDLVLTDGQYSLPDGTEIQATQTAE